MFNNYPPDAHMNEYFHEQDVSDQIEAELNNAADEALSLNASTLKDNLAIVYDQSDGVESNDQTFPYPVFYNVR